MQSQLPPVVKSDFLHPIEAVFRGLENESRNALKTLIYHCIYGDLR